MKKTNLPILILIAICAALSISAQGQNDKIEQAIAKALREMPSSAASPREFIPKDWTVNSVEQGDLNGDGLTDYVLDMVIDDTARERIMRNEDGTMFLTPSIIVVTFGGAGNRQYLFAANSRLKAMYEFSNLFTARVVKNVVVVDEDYSSSNDANHVTFRYRYDPTEKRLMLIGFDFEYYTRDKIGNSVKTSENYLTGDRIITVKESERRRNGEFYYARTKITKEKFKPRRIAFEDTFLNREGGYIEARPF